MPRQKSLVTAIRELVRKELGQQIGNLLGNIGGAGKVKRRRRAGRNSAAGRRGRPRSAYEAPRAAVDRSTRFIGAESKRRGRPRLPAPPSRVTLLIWNDLSNVLVTFPFLSLWSGAGGGRGGRIDG